MKPIILWILNFTLVILNNIALPPETSLELCNNSIINSFANNIIGYKGLLEGNYNSLGYTAGGSLTVDAAPIFCNFYYTKLLIQIIIYSNIIFFLFTNILISTSPVFPR